MKISVILPTLGEREKELTRLLTSLSEQTFTSFEVVVVSQGNHERVSEIIDGHPLDFTHIQLHQKGLSLARNEGLKVSKGDVVTFSDDDCWYPPHAFQMVAERHNADVVCFQVYDPDKEDYLKQYPPNPQKEISKKDVLNKSSIEFFVDVRKIRKLPQFDEHFGLGTDYPSGEENIFLMDLYKLGCSISYIPEVVVYHEKYDGFKQLTKEKYISKGPLFVRLFNLPKALLFLIYFFIKKRKFINNNPSFLTASIGHALKYSVKK